MVSRRLQYLSEEKFCAANSMGRIATESLRCVSDGIEHQEDPTSLSYYMLLKEYQVEPSSTNAAAGSISLAGLPVFDFHEKLVSATY